MNIAILGTVGLLILWIVLTFVMAIPSGWVHVPLVLATLLLVKGIVDQQPKNIE